MTNDEVAPGVRISRNLPAANSSNAELLAAYEVCKARGHTSNGLTLTSNPPWEVCKYCGTHYRLEIMQIERNVPVGRQ